MSRVRTCALWMLVLSTAPLGGCASSEAAPLEVAVTRGDIVASGSYQGELVAKKTTSMSAPKVPRIDSLTVKTILPDGTKVAKGDVVATFDTTELEDNQRSARSDLAIAQAERAKSEHALATEKISLELEQQRRRMAVEEANLRLVEGVNLVSKLERDKAAVNLRSAEIELELATSALGAFARKRKTSLDVQDIKVKTAEGVVADNDKALEGLAMKAPGEGVIFRPYVTLNYQRAKAEPGRVCRPGDKLLELPDLSVYEVEIYVRPRDAARISVGDAARVQIVAVDGLVIPAKVLKKESFATTRNERYGTKTPEGNLKEIAIRLELSSFPEGLRPGGTVRAEIDSMLKKDAVTVPLYAVDEEGGAHHVTLPGGERRDITLGVMSATHAEVLTGLEAGQVVTFAASAPPGTKAAEGGKKGRKRGPKPE